MPWLDANNPRATLNLWELAIHRVLRNVKKSRESAYGGGPIQVLACMNCTQTQPPLQLTRCDLSTREVGMLLINPQTKPIHFVGKLQANAPGSTGKIDHPDLINECLPPAISIPLGKRISGITAAILSSISLATANDEIQASEYALGVRVTMLPAKVALLKTLKKVPDGSRTYISIRGAAVSMNADENTQASFKSWAQGGANSLPSDQCKFELDIEAVL